MCTQDAELDGECTAASAYSAQTEGLTNQEQQVQVCRTAMYSDPLFFSSDAYDAGCKQVIMAWAPQADKDYMQAGFVVANADLVVDTQGPEALEVLASYAGIVVSKKLLNQAGQVDLTLFTKRSTNLPGGMAEVGFVHPKTGWYIQEDVLKGQAHGGSVYKLFNQYGERIATLDEFGNVLRK